VVRAAVAINPRLDKLQSRFAHRRFTVALSAFSTGDNAKSAMHYSRCIVRSRMKSDQLADGVLRFAQARPDLHAKPLLGALLLQYLVAVCGDPPR
jgi:hypothetical protein